MMVVQSSSVGPWDSTNKYSTIRARFITVRNIYFWEDYVKCSVCWIVSLFHALCLTITMEESLLNKYITLHTTIQYNAARGKIPGFFLFKDNPDFPFFIWIHGLQLKLLAFLICLIFLSNRSPRFYHWNFAILTKQFSVLIKYSFYSSCLWYISYPSHHFIYESGA